MTTTNRSATDTFKAASNSARQRLLVMDTNVVVELVTHLLKPRGIKPAIRPLLAQGSLTPAQAYQASGLAVPATLHLFEEIKKNRITLAFCARSIKELDYIIQDPYEKNTAFEGTLAKQRNAIKGFLYSHSLTFDEAPAPLRSCDPDDQCFLNTAQAAIKAGYTRVDIVSLDHHLSKMRRHAAPFGIYKPQAYAHTLPRLELPPVKLPSIASGAHNRTPPKTGMPKPARSKNICPA